MADYVSEYTLRFNDLASRGFLRVANVSRRVVTGLRDSSKWISVTTAAFGAAMVVSNRMTAQQDALARSVGISRDSILGLEGAAKSIGLEFDNVIDLQEEINNKFGEMAAAGELPITAIEGLRGLGFADADFENIAAIADINVLVNKALESVADGSRTVAEVQSALDQLAGGEANKILGAVINKGFNTVEELNAHYERLNHLTEDGTRGAVAFNSSFADLTFTLQTLIQEGFGKLGGVLAPVIDKFVQFLSINKEIIAANLGSFMTSLGTRLSEIDFNQIVEKASGFLISIQDIASKIGEFVNMVGGIDTIAVSLGGLFALGAASPLLSALGGIVAILGGPITLAITGVIAAGIALYRNWDEVVAAATRLWQGLETAWVAIRDGFTGAMLAVGTIVEGVWNRIKSIIESGVNFVIDIINGLIARINAAGEGLSRLPGVEIGGIQSLERLDLTGAAGANGNDGRVMIEIDASKLGGATANATASGSAVIDSGGSNSPV